MIVQLLKKNWTELSYSASRFTKLVNVELPCKYQITLHINLIMAPR